MIEFKKIEDRNGQAITLMVFEDNPDVWRVSIDDGNHSVLLVPEFEFEEEALVFGLSLLGHSFIDCKKERE
jgi:hypothetical protein